MFPPPLTAADELTPAEHGRRLLEVAPDTIRVMSDAIKVKVIGLAAGETAGILTHRGRSLSPLVTSLGETAPLVLNRRNVHEQRKDFCRDRADQTGNARGMQVAACQTLRHRLSTR